MGRSIEEARDLVSNPYRKILIEVFAGKGKSSDERFQSLQEDSNPLAFLGLTVKSIRVSNPYRKILIISHSASSLVRLSGFQSLQEDSNPISTMIITVFLILANKTLLAIFKIEKSKYP